VDLERTSAFDTADATGLPGGASRFLLHLIHPFTAFFSPFRSDGVAVAAE
jgi:hypothetical protein